MVNVRWKEREKGGRMRILGGAGFALFMTVFLYGPTLKAQIQPEEFRRRTSNHIERVVILGEALHEQFPEHFGNLSPQIVQEYLSEFHDVPKLMSLLELSNHGYTGTHTISEVLARFFGISRRVNTLSPSDSDLLNNAIDELNRIEGNLKRTFFLMKNLSPEEIQSLTKLERIADLTDTGIARWAELGVAKDQALASTFVSQTEGQEHLLPLILWLEKHYDAVLFSGRMISCQSVLQSIAQ